MATHHLKTWPTFFDAIKDGRKTFEFRKNDRQFMEGDLLILQKWDPEEEMYLNEELLCKITYLFDQGFGLPKGYVILSFKNPVYYSGSTKAFAHARLMDVTMTEEDIQRRRKRKYQNDRRLHAELSKPISKHKTKNKNATHSKKTEEVNITGCVL